MEKQIAYEIIDECYTKVLGGNFDKELILKLRDMENEQQEAKGQVERWHLPGEEPEREIKYDDRLRSNEKIIALVKSRLGTRATIIHAHLVEKKGRLRFEGYRFTVKDIILWRLEHKPPKRNLYNINPETTSNH